MLTEGQGTRQFPGRWEISNEQILPHRVPSQAGGISLNVRGMWQSGADLHEETGSWRHGRHTRIKTRISHISKESLCTWMRERVVGHPPRLDPCLNLGPECFIGA